MSKIYDLLNSVVAKLKATEKSVPKKVSDLEQDVKPSWNELEGKPFGDEEAWDTPSATKIWSNGKTAGEGPLTSMFSNRASAQKIASGDAKRWRIIIDETPYDTAILDAMREEPGVAIAGNAEIKGFSSQYSTLPDAPFCFIVYGAFSARFYFSDGADHGVAFSASTTVTTPLDPKFIPESIARTSDIPEPFSGSYNDLTDKPEIPDHTWESLPDKPFGEETKADKIYALTSAVLEWSSYNGSHNAFPQGANPLLIGAPATIVIENATYELPYGGYYKLGMEGYPWWGNHSLLDSTQENTGETFCIKGSGSMSTPSDGDEWSIESIWTNDQTLTQYSMSVYYIGESTIVTTLDPKFIPIDAITQSVIEALPTAEGGSF